MITSSLQASQARDFSPAIDATMRNYVKSKPVYIGDATEVFFVPLKRLLPADLSFHKNNQSLPGVVCALTAKVAQGEWNINPKNDIKLPALNRFEPCTSNPY